MYCLTWTIFKWDDLGHVLRIFDSMTGRHCDSQLALNHHVRAHACCSPRWSSPLPPSSTDSTHFQLRCHQSHSQGPTALSTLMRNAKSKTTSRRTAGIPPVGGREPHRNIKIAPLTRETTFPHTYSRALARSDKRTSGHRQIARMRGWLRRGRGSGRVRSWY